MTLSSLIGSLTRRQAPPPALASPQRPSTSLGTGPSTSLGTGPSTSLGTGAAHANALAQYATLEFVPAKETEHALGAQREVRERIADVLPGVVFDEEGKGAFTRNGYAVSFDTGHEDYVRIVRVEVTGGSAAMPPLQRLMAKTGWRLMPGAARD
jgi:hypothetical protein